MHTAMTVRIRPALIAVLAALVVVIAAGCGASSDAVPELTSFNQVAQTSSATDTARFDLTLKATVPGLKNELSFVASGGFDTPAKRAEMKVDLSAIADVVQGLSSQFGGKVTGDRGSPSDWKLEAIQDGDTIYVNFPLIAKKLPAGKTWVKGDASTISKANAGQLSQFGPLAGTDPTDVFGVLKAVSGSIEAVGTDELRGVQTNHYRATIDLAKMAALIPEAQRQGLGPIDDAAKQAGLDNLPLDIWIDADNQVHKLSIDLDVKPPGSKDELKASLVVEFYDYGKPLDLSLPPADQVADIATLKNP